MDNLQRADQTETILNANGFDEVPPESSEQTLSLSL